MRMLTQLYPYQRAAVDKLIGLRVGALYMEMGTGKTRTALELIRRRLDAGKIAHVLWLCPCSVRLNLRSDIAKHAEGALQAIAIYGIESLSSSTRIYGLLDRYVSAAPTMLVVDESLLVKTPWAIRTRRVTRLAAKCPYRLILNGTPVGRDEADLFAQWYLLDWRILGYQSYYSFAANHLEYDERYRSKVRRTLHVDYLADKIAPYSYIATKEDCLKLPDKAYHLTTFEFTEEQFIEYQRVLTLYLNSFVERADALGDAAIYRAFTALQEVSSGRRIISPVDKPIRHERMFAPMDNPRIQALLDGIARMEDGKAVIWCKFMHEIEDVAYALERTYGPGCAAQFHGKIRPKARDAALERFRGETRFLVANKGCAGLGLNLQHCHLAIYYNNDWNWAMRIQSEDRIHRIGQEHTVKILDICAAAGIDCQILRCLDRKERLADQLRSELEARNADAWFRARADDVLKEGLSNDWHRL